MRVKKEEREAVKSKILNFLNNTKLPHNISEIARAIDKAPPTVSKFVEELAKENKVSIYNKKSMKLVTIQKKCI